MPTKKTPAKKAAPKKKSAKKVSQKKSPGKKVKSSGQVQFTLSVKSPYSVKIKRAGTTNSYQGTIDLQSGDAVVMSSTPQIGGNPELSSGYSHVEVKQKRVRKIGIGYNVPPTQNTRTKIRTDLSIFDKIQRSPKDSRIEFQKTAAGQTIFTMGIEG